MFNCKCVLEVYGKEDELLVDSYEIKNISTRRLAEAFGVTEEVFSGDGFLHVTEKQVGILEEYIGIKIDLDKYYYSVGTISV